MALNKAENGVQNWVKCKGSLSMTCYEVLLFSVDHRDACKVVFRTGMSVPILMDTLLSPSYHHPVTIIPALIMPPPAGSHKSWLEGISRVDSTLVSPSGRRRPSSVVLMEKLVIRQAIFLTVYRYRRIRYRRFCRYA